MPTTRSQGRHEPLQHLDTPPKRQRKQRAKKPRITLDVPQELHMRTLSMSPEPTPLLDQAVTQAPAPIVPDASRHIITLAYADASTQTDEVVILTQAEVDDLQDRASEAMSNKRARGDESEDEPVAKRHQFSTPQHNKPNNLWMFGGMTNGDHPRTAPSKSITAASFRRTTRGPYSRRSNLNETLRPRNQPSVSPIRTATFDSIHPIEQKRAEYDRGRPAQEKEEETATQVQQSQSQQPQSHPPETPRRGLFGSLRGMVGRGWDLAASLTPLGSRTEPAPTSPSNSQPDGVAYPHIQSSTETSHLSNDDDKTTNSSQQAQYGSARSARHVPQHQHRSRDYDHLHYIPADADSVDKAMNGEIEPPPRAPTPLSPTSRLKAQNPKLSDATIQAILKKRERKAAMDTERYGPQPTPEVSNVAPLFGPDSHYARGTVDPRFLPPTPLYGPSKKRKLEFANGQTSSSNNMDFETNDEQFDTDNEVDIVSPPTTNDEQDNDEPAAKRHRINEGLTVANLFPVTPRSALKKPGLTGSIGRKSVAFGASISRDIRGHYGPAGQYKGSTFADELPDDSRSLSSIDQADVISPTTRLNTITNSGWKAPSVLDNLGANIPKIDFTLRDPNDANWRPSLGNPRPGAFRVPDIDEEDPDETMGDDEPLEQPQTPRISHAELPPAPNTLGSKSFNESSILDESTELALDKARSKAEKYKPKSSSRLSEVSRARSRSTSPDGDDDEEMGMNEAGDVPRTTAPAVRRIGAPPQPFVPSELDNIHKGSDGMTDYEREHQYDDWAAKLHWDAPQTYEESGTGSAFIQNLIRKNWTEEDSQKSEQFWAREFDEVEEAMKAAKAKGQNLILITGMEEIEGY